MADALTVFFVILHILSWPFHKLINLVAIIVSPFWLLASFLLLPCIHLVRTIINVLLFPFSLQWRERFEVIISSIHSQNRSFTTQC